MAQLLLLPDARPLDERLGRQFFEATPRRPGVYLMRDAEGRVLYVGKAKDLKQRLNHYRVANPDRMPRRHLRLVREVRRIDLQFCESEAAALAHEASLLRSLKPKFNRAGVWPGRSRFLAWRVVLEQLEMAVVETPECGWRRFGPLGGAAASLHGALARLLWLAVNPNRAVAELPAGWARGGFRSPTLVQCGPGIAEVLVRLDAYFWESVAPLVEWLGSQCSGRAAPFERAVIDAELETLRTFAEKQPQPASQQLALI
jgi:hypothetical protein